MSKSKFLRCTHENCRTLTRAGLCDRHRARAPAPASVWDGITASEWEAARIKASAAFNEILRVRAQRDVRRADLAALQDGATKALSRLERPVFSVEL
jgi:hypothetical protein